MLDFFVKRKPDIPINKNTSPTICPLPFMSFYGTASGAIVACCESQETKLGDSKSKLSQVWNNAQYKNLRQDLISGRRPELCKKCWKNETAGLKSNRIQALEDYESCLLGKREVLTKADGIVEDFPSFVELKCSNICNLKCRMCHPESSHRIAEDKDIIDHYRKGLPWNPYPLRPTFLFEQIRNLSHQQLNNIRVLQYSGGEPLISKEQFELSSFLANKYGQNIQLRYSTNLNNLIFEKYNVLELWRQFRHVHVKISADGINDVYNYVRTGGSFDVLRKNLDTLLSAQIPNLDIAIGFTTQTYNVFQLPEFLDFFSQYVSTDRITTHLLYTPKILCIENIPASISEKIIKKLESSRWDLESKVSFLKNNSTKSESEETWLKFLSYTRALEKKYEIENGFEFLLEKYLN